MTNEQIQKEIDAMKERVRLLEELRTLQAKEQELTNRSPYPPQPPLSRFWYRTPNEPTICQAPDKYIDRIYH